MGRGQVIAWRPLGELLVERGLLSAGEIESALAEQVETGERLGTILVARRAITGVMLTTVLAEQAGVPLETETGFGSGLFSKLAERHALDERPAPVTPPPATDPDAGQLPSGTVAGPDSPAFELSALRTEVEMLRVRNEELEAELAAKRRARRRSSKPAA